jgi:hypothetical protein
VAIATLALAHAACESQRARLGARPPAENIEKIDASPRESAPLVPLAPSAPPSATPARDGGDELRVVRFAWRPPGGDEAAYAMADPEDQHRIVIIGGSSPDAYPVVVALHGQPKRGQSPRSYSFAARVIDVARDLVSQGQVPPLVLALPVFRFRGLDWPSFDLAAFRGKVEDVMKEEGLAAKEFYVVGHSGAAGCGGDGLNRAHRMHPAAVGFFDTCLGAGWQNEIRELERARVPVSILQSVETAGVQPRQLREYDGRYDFGTVFRSVGLAPVECPSHVPDAPLRSQAFRCAADANGLTRAFVVDTGEGDEAHNALVSVAIAYFLREHLPRAR